MYVITKFAGLTTACLSPIKPQYVLFGECYVWPLERRVLMSLKACACNLWASANHSCESHRFVVEAQRDTLPSPMCHIFPWAFRQKHKEDGLGMPAHVILQRIHVERLWPQSWALQISIWDNWTWAHRGPDWLRPVLPADTGVLSALLQITELDVRKLIQILIWKCLSHESPSLHWRRERSEMNKRQKNKEDQQLTDCGDPESQ